MSSSAPATIPDPSEVVPEITLFEKAEEAARNAIQHTAREFFGEGTEWVERSGRRYLSVPAALVAQRFGLQAAPALLIFAFTTDYSVAGAERSSSPTYSFSIYPCSTLPTVQTFDAFAGHNPSGLFGGAGSANTPEDLQRSLLVLWQSLETSLTQMKSGDFTDACRAPFSRLSA